MSRRRGLRVTVVLVERFVECRKKLRRKHSLHLLIDGRRRAVIANHMGTLLCLGKKALELDAHRRAETYGPRGGSPSDGCRR
jgi:hypothetical protein